MQVIGFGFSPDSLVGIFSLGLVCVCITLLFLRKKTTVRSDQNSSKHIGSGGIGAKDDADIEGTGSTNLTVLYGTQTGTAEGFGKAFGEEARARYGKDVCVNVVGLDNYGNNDVDFGEILQKESVAVFFVATYGDGEPTDDAARFFTWLKKTAEESSEVEENTESPYGDLKFAVFGLGNRQYEHFNAVGLAVDSRLNKLGATRLAAVGLGDDDICIEDDFHQWMSSLWPHLDAALSLSSPVTASHATVDIPCYDVTVLEEEMAAAVAAKVEHGQHRESSASSSSTFRSRVVVCRELHSSLSERSCLHVELDITEAGIEYQSGDHVAVHAENSADTVQEAAECLGLSLDLVFSLAVPEGDSILPEPFPTPCSLRAALAQHADLLNSPKKSALLALAAHASNDSEAVRLRHLSSPEGKVEYQQWVVESQRSLLEVMSAFPSARPPLGVFFAAVAPRLQPRFYSISSSPRHEKSRIHITCSLVKDRTPSGRLHNGVCSSWLRAFLPANEGNSVQSNGLVPIFVRSSLFCLPPDPRLPVVMVGPGTGVAPFRAFLQERSALIREGCTVGPALLFFGCRESAKDHIYKEEMEAFLKEGALSDLFVAYSREGDSKLYVQHLMKAQAKKVWSLLSEGGHFYVCGDAKAMARDVHKTLVTIAQNRECVSVKEAEDIVKELQTSGRYLRDVW